MRRRIKNVSKIAPRFAGRFCCWSLSELASKFRDNLSAFLHEMGKAFVNLDLSKGLTSKVFDQIVDYVSKNSRDVFLHSRFLASFCTTVQEQHWNPMQLDNWWLFVCFCGQVQGLHWIWCLTSVLVIGYLTRIESPIANFVFDFVQRIDAGRCCWQQCNRWQ